MFTGIIEHLGKIVRKRRDMNGLTLVVEHSLGYLKAGESIAVNGVCLTVSHIEPSLITFDVSPETQHKTTLDELINGECVHLERALTLNTPLGGHFVTGHIDQVLRIQQIKPEGQFTQYVFEGVVYPQWLVDKGSIALDGVSLTINRILTEERFECMIIPHTKQWTRFKYLKVADRVNAEYDYLAKIVARQHTLAQNKSAALGNEDKQ